MPRSRVAHTRRLSPLASRLSPLAALPGLRWIRLLYCYPSYFSPALIEAIGCTLPRGIEPRSTIKWYQTRGPRAESYGHWTDGDRWGHEAAEL